MGYLEKAKKVLGETKAERRPSKVEHAEWRALSVFSKVLGREIVVSWRGERPSVVYVDRTPYTLKEIAQLKGLNASGVKVAHEVKSEFAVKRKTFDERMLNHEKS